MPSILSNGTRIYNWNNLILRSPISKTLSLTPTECLCFDVGDQFVQQIPTRDFFVNSRGVYSIASGHDCRQAYLGYKYPPQAYYIWRNNTAFGTLPDTGSMWYNGNYSPAYGTTGGAAFIRMEAYKFSIPSKYSNYVVSDVKIQTGDIGTVMVCSSPAQQFTTRVQDRLPVFAWDAASNILDPSSSLRGRSVQIKFGCWTQNELQAKTPSTMYSESQLASTISLQPTDATNADNYGRSPYIPLWIDWPSGTVRYQDGVIPDAPNNPHIQTHTSNASFNAKCSANRDFYISLLFDVSDSRAGDSTVTQNDYPYYYMPTSSTSYYKTWWACQRFWINKIDITIDID